MMNLPAQIRSWRSFKGLSQSMLAKISGIPRPNLIDLETGRRDCTIKTLTRLAQALGISPGTLLDNSPTKIPKLTRFDIDHIARALCYGKPENLPEPFQNINKLLEPIVAPLLRAGGILPSNFPLRISRRASYYRIKAQDQIGVENLERIIKRINKLVASRE